MQTPKTVTIGGKKLVVGKDCVIIGKKHKAAGKYVLVVKGIGNYSGKTEVVFVIKKAKQKIKVSAEQKAYKTSKLKKKGTFFNLKTKAISQRLLTQYLLSRVLRMLRSISKYLRKGKVTIKKGLKKGAYKIVIKRKLQRTIKLVRRQLELL